MLIEAGYNWRRGRAGDRHINRNIDAKCERVHEIAAVAVDRGDAMIRDCDDGDVAAIRTIINAAAHAYKGVIPADRWTEPYMPEAELRGEIEAGVGFCGYLEDGRLRGVMGTQEIEDVTLIRHAYVAPAHQRRGIGGALLDRVAGETTTPILIGTWADAGWAVRFYRKHGFRLVPAAAARILLKRYWSIPDRQIETSVVLADPAWFAGAAT